MVSKDFSRSIISLTLLSSEKISDAFELFLENGIFNKKIANKFLNHILSKGGIDHPLKLYKKFRGKAPDPSALLRRAGIM